MEQTPSQLLTITAIREEVPGVKTFVLAPDDGVPVPCRAGQFLTFLFHNPAGEDRRSYSVSGCPHLGEPLAITVKRIENGRHSRWLIDHASTGDRLRCTGAAGLFVLPEDLQPYRQIFLFAAGIGITPLYALLKEIFLRGAGIQVVLIYSNRSSADAVFYQELLHLQAQHKDQMRIEWLFSTARNLLRARFSKAIMPYLMQEYLRALPEETLCYTCGPYDYMWLTTLLLEEAGIPAANIRKEIFYNEKPGIRLAPPDTEAHRVTIRIGKTVYHTTAQYPETILQAAKRDRIPLPYSCETGQCSSCAVQCVSGRVWLSYNEVLTDNDLAAGSVLTCTGHPVGGDVVIQLIRP